MTKRAQIITTLLTCLALPFVGCAKSSSPASSGGSAATGSAPDVLDSAISSVNSSMNDVEQAPAYVRHPIWENLFESSAYAAACGTSRFTPLVGSASCAGTVGNDTVTASFNSCTAGSNNQYTFNGSASLTFDSAATCSAWIAGTALPTSGNVTRTTSNFVRTNPDGTTVASVSNPAVNYLGATIQGGEETIFGSPSRTLNILGMNRIKKAADGQTVLYNHSVYTLNPLMVTGTRAANNRTISTGTIEVDHNIADYSATASLAGLSWISACCYPTTGSVTFSYTGSVSGSFTADFNTGTCGLVNITAGGAATQVALAACE